MNQQFGPLLYTISVWALPAVIAITFHEAAHGFVARFLGDDTAWRLGRVTLNPLKHIDQVGTILLPALLLVLHSPFLFGYAKPVPIKKTAIKRIQGLIRCNQPVRAKPPAAIASQTVMTNIIRFRSTMSASAPAGSVKKKNGNEATVAIRERNNGEVLTRFIVQVAAVSCAATHVPEIILANHMFRKTGFRRAVQVEFSLIGAADLID